MLRSTATDDEEFTRGVFLLDLGDGLLRLSGLSSRLRVLVLILIWQGHFPLR